MGACVSSRRDSYPSDDLFHKSPTTMPELVVPETHPASPKYLLKDVGVQELRHELFVSRPCAAALSWDDKVRGTRAKSSISGRRKRSSSWPYNKGSEKGSAWDSKDTSLMEWDEKL